MKELETKKVPNLKRLMMVVAMTAFVVSHAFAADAVHPESRPAVFAPTPKAESVIMHDKITLGDVFDGVTDNADYYLAPAPAMGHSVTLNAYDLKRISDALNLGWEPQNPLVHVVIRRLSSEINHFDIEPALNKKLTEEMGGRKIDVELANPALSFRVPVGAAHDVNVSSMTYDAAQGTFSAMLSFPSLPGVKQEVKGNFYQIVKVPVLKAPARQGDVISADDIDYIDMRAKDIASSIIVDAHRLVGLTPRQGIPAMKPVLAVDMRLPEIVRKGDLVVMALKSNIISLTAQGRALNDGAEGDTVRVMNTSSKQVVEGVVTGPQQVSVRSPDSILSMNAL